MLQELAPSNSSNNSSQPGMTVLAPLNSAIDTFMGSLDSGTQSALMASPRAIVALLAYHAITPPPLRSDCMQPSNILYAHCTGQAVSRYVGMVSLLG